MSIGKKIKDRRTELGWSQRELSVRMGYSNHSTIARIEAGTVDIPQSKVVKFAEVMGTTVAYLMDWEDVKKEHLTQIEKKNDDLADIVIRMQTDEVFYVAVKSLAKMKEEKLISLLTLLK